MADRDELDWIARNEPWRLPKKIFSREQLKHKNRDEQVEILNSYGIKDIPRYEGERIDKILELQNKQNTRRQE
jgi:hypothetical protein